MKHIYHIIVTFLLIILLPSHHYAANTITENQCLTNQPFIVHTMYGIFTITEPVLIDLFNHPIMERIKHVRQYGAEHYVIKQKKEYTRYEHCVGVWALLRMYGASLEEQIAGLLHDTSHTVFSHVGDVLFRHTSTHYSYQDSIHQWYLQQYNIDSLLARYTIPFQKIYDHSQHMMLEQDLPDICADRLEYNLQAGLLTDMLTLDDIKTILNDLRYHEGHWFFVSVESAKKLALVSLFNTEFVWASPAACYISQWTSNALERALQLKLIDYNDIHFSTDNNVWNILINSNDSVIMHCLENIMNYAHNISTDFDKKQLLMKKKFRGLNPLIKENNELKRLTEIDNEYKKEYTRIKIVIEQN